MSYLYKILFFFGVTLLVGFPPIRCDEEKTLTGKEEQFEAEKNFQQRI